MTAGLVASVALRLGRLDLSAALEVAPGETVAVLGPNGAGKTTLLRAIAGLQPLDRGSVVLDGAVLDDTERRVAVEPARRAIGVVFQEYLLFPHLSVLENVAFGPRSCGVRRRAARASAAAALDDFGLTAYAGRRPQVLSGGQAQRVALARAMVTRPRLLLLDEPLAALDVSARAATRRDLRRHLDSYDGAAIVVTHDPIEAAALADRLVVLEAGQVIQTGTLPELAARPRSRYVADLVGTNLLTGHADGHLVIVGGVDGVDRRDAPPLTVAETIHGDVFLAIHPRAVALHRHAPEGTPRNVWRTTAAEVDWEGERVRVRLGGPLPLVAEVTPGAIAALAIGVGDEVWVSVKATEINVFGS